MSVSKDAKIAIIGAGPAGISAAYYLRQKGYENVTLFEKEGRIGGKCYSHPHKDTRLDLGAILISPSNRNLLKLIKDHKVKSIRQLGNHWVYHTDKKIATSIRESDMFPYKLSTTLACLWRFCRLSYRYRWLKKPGYFNIPPELMVPFESFMKEHQLEPLSHLFETAMTSMGYGSLKDIHAFMGIKFLKLQGFIAFFMIMLTGKNPFKIIKIANGYLTLWEAVAKETKLVLNANITKIQYKDDKVYIHSKTGIECFDKLIIATPLDKIADQLESSAMEKALAKKIRYRLYICHLFKVNSPQSPNHNFFFIPPKLDADPVIILSYSELDNAYVSYSANEKNVNDAELKQRLVDFMVQFGVKPEAIEFIATQEWRSYYPYVALSDVKDGYYEKLNALQGKQNTYYTGGLFAFEAVEPCVSFSKYMVEKYF